MLHFVSDLKSFSCPDLTTAGQLTENQGSPLNTQPLKETYLAELQKNFNFRDVSAQCTTPDLVTTVPSVSSPLAPKPVESALMRQSDSTPPIANIELNQQSPALEQTQQNTNANAPSSQAAFNNQQPNGEIPKQMVAQSGQGKRSQAEFEARSKSVAENSKSLQNAGFNNYDTGTGRANSGIEVRMSTMTPHWIGNDLVLARRVDVESREYIQGCLLDWPGLKRQLLDEVADLLPHADLQRTADEGEATEVRRLASLPVMLLSGALPADASPDAAGLSPIKQSLLIAWGAMGLAALAAAALLHGVIALSERRAAFVSAVTHELRTPLTTFRLYAEMLSEGMVRGESERRQYLDTLRIEADRLTHLVANVLAYARLERGSRAGRCECISVSRLLEIATERLADRAAQSRFELSIEPEADVLSRDVRADPGAVEQILFNLVDNACKYAATAEQRTLHLSVSQNERRVWIRLHDHGAGVAINEQRRLFKPFRKSARDAARSAPGVGLGLALSQRLAARHARRFTVRKK